MRTGFVRLVFPYALLFLLTLAAVHVPVLLMWSASIPRIIPYAVWGAGALLGWRFNRSRVVFAMLALAIADYALVQLVGSGATATPSGRLIHQTVAVLLPLNILAFALLKERGVLTLRGISRLTLTCSQPLAFAWLVQSPRRTLLAYLEYPLIRLPQLGWLPLAQPALLAFAVALAVLAIQAVRQRKAMECGFFWATLAALGAFCGPRPGHFTSLHLAVAGLILLVAMVESSYAMAFRDELTGLPARRALNDLQLRLGTQYTVAMVDIDFFKKFNDRYGHDVGDQVLRKVAGILARVDGGGRAFRYGGEEFTIVFPGKRVEEVLGPLEQLRSTVAASAFVVRGRKRPRTKPQSPQKAAKARQKVSITISIGAAERSDRSHAHQEVIKAADRALYRAKRAGRNRVAI
jgi:diguanylate cyclase (GGDEF)-like protein